MKGIVFNLLEELVTEAHGADAWDGLLAQAKLRGVYTSLGNYGDAELVALVAAASKALVKTPDEIVRWFGAGCIPKFAKLYPAFFAPHKDTRSFLLTLNDIIHPEVRKLYPGADVPVFTFDTLGADGLSLGYKSKRKLCAFAEGLIRGAAAHYRQSVTITQRECMARGDDRCLLECRFAPAAKGPA